MDIDHHQSVTPTFVKPNSTPENVRQVDPTPETISQADSTQQKVTIVTAKKNRCFQCNKRLGLLPFTCKCGANYCTRCKWPEDHHCTFDYRAEGMKKLAKENPVIVADKLTRI